ncbi:MAG: acyl-CoA dehydrogenase family protein, partial [Pyrinomonadaceae bacterium]
MLNLDVTLEKQELIDRVAVLARENFAPRAAYYDQTATFPAEDFEDLFRAGLNAPCVPQEYGGLGLGPYSGDVFTLWMMTKELAKADLSLARCWEGHNNSLVLLDGIASESQKALW